MLALVAPDTLLRRTPRSTASRFECNCKFRLEEKRLPIPVCEAAGQSSKWRSVQEERSAWMSKVGTGARKGVHSAAPASVHAACRDRRCARRALIPRQASSSLGAHEASSSHRAREPLLVARRGGPCRTRVPSPLRRVLDRSFWNELSSMSRGRRAAGRRAENKDVATRNESSVIADRARQPGANAAVAQTPVGKLLFSFSTGREGERGGGRVRLAGCSPHERAETAQRGVGFRAVSAEDVRADHEAGPYTSENPAPRHWTLICWRAADEEAIFGVPFCARFDDDRSVRR